MRCTRSSTLSLLIRLLSRYTSYGKANGPGLGMVQSITSLAAMRSRA